jgi:7-carboxy-7-deazaguanine synthase
MSLEETISISEIFGPVIQGEGALIGRPTVFVRTGGCDYRCAWCDTLYAVLPSFRMEWRRMNAREIMDEVAILSSGHAILITLSGGNPALQSLDSLLDLGRERGYAFALETQGSVAKAWFAKLTYLILSPKPPSSRMEIDWDALGECLAAGMSTRVIFKIVVFDDADYGFARQVHARFPHVAMYLQPGNPTPDVVDAAPGEAVLAMAASTSSRGMSTHGGDLEFETRENRPDRATEHDAVGVCERAATQLTWLLERTSRDGWNDVTLLPQLHVLLWGNKRGV